MFGYHEELPPRERKPRKHFGLYPDGKPVLPAATERELAATSNPNDHEDRFEPVFESNGHRARVHLGSDGEASQDDDVVDQTNEVRSARNYREVVGDDDGEDENVGVRVPDILDELVEMESVPF